MKYKHKNIIWESIGQKSKIMEGKINKDYGDAGFQRKQDFKTYPAFVSTGSVTVLMLEDGDGLKGMIKAKPGYLSLMIKLKTDSDYKLFSKFLAKNKIKDHDQSGGYMTHNIKVSVSKKGDISHLQQTFLKIQEIDPNIPKEITSKFNKTLKMEKYNNLSRILARFIAKDMILSNKERGKLPKLALKLIDESTMIYGGPKSIVKKHKTHFVGKIGIKKATKLGNKLDLKELCIRGAKSTGSSLFPLDSKKEKQVKDFMKKNPNAEVVGYSGDSTGGTLGDAINKHNNNIKLYKNSPVTLADSILKANKSGKLDLSRVCASAENSLFPLSDKQEKKVKDFMKKNPNAKVLGYSGDSTGGTIGDTINKHNKKIGKNISKNKM